MCRHWIGAMCPECREEEAKLAAETRWANWAQRACRAHEESKTVCHGHVEAACSAAHAAGRRAGLEEIAGLDQPWTLPDVLERLAAYADHALKAHDCDHVGWELDQGCRDRALEYAAAIRRAAAQREGT